MRGWADCLGERAEVGDAVPPELAAEMAAEMVEFLDGRTVRIPRPR